MSVLKEFKEDFVLLLEAGFVAVKWLDDLDRHGRQPFPVYVLATKSLLLQWQEQIAEHSDFISRVLVGTAKQKIETLKKPAHLYIVKYDSIQSAPVLRALGMARSKTTTYSGKVKHTFRFINTNAPIAQPTSLSVSKYPGFLG